MFRAIAFFQILALLAFLGCGKQAQMITYSNPLVHTNWIEILDHPSVDMLGQQYDLTWDTATEDLFAAINSDYELQDPQAFFKTKGRRFFPDWKVSFESGIQIANGWAKGLREHYVFAPASREECVVIELTQDKITAVYHQFKNGSRNVVRPSGQFYEKTEPSPTDYERITEPKHKHQGAETSVLAEPRINRLLLVDTFRRDRIQYIYPYEVTWKSLPIDSQLLQKIYTFPWGASPVVATASEPLLDGLNAISAAEFRSYLEQMLGFSDKTEDLLAALMRAKQVEVNSYELDSRTYYLFGTQQNKWHPRWDSTPETIIVVLEFESERIVKVAQVYRFLDDTAAVVLVEPTSTGSIPFFSTDTLRVSVFAIAILSILFCLGYLISRTRLKKRKYRPFVASARQSSRPRAFPSGAHSAEPSHMDDIIDADIIDHDEG